MASLRFGVRVPSFAWPELRYEDARSLGQYCRRVEELGFSDIWTLDHLLRAPALYDIAWLDPLAVLTYAAALTERVGLGTAALVLPIRHPVLLARELATLQHLSGGRAILGIATGWDDGEFRAMDVPRTQRGARTDEALALLGRLLVEEEVTFSGRFHQVAGVTIWPRVPDIPPVWVAGGSLEHAAETPDAPRIVPAVLRRLLGAQGWMSRSSGSDSTSVKRDWDEVQATLSAYGRDPSSLIFAHTQFVHIVETADRERALAEQLPAFTRVMGDHRSAEDLAASYLLGTIEEIQKRVADLAAAGLQYLILTPVSPEQRQLELLTKHVVAPFTDGIALADHHESEEER